MINKRRRQRSERIEPVFERADGRTGGEIKADRRERAQLSHDKAARGSKKAAGKAGAAGSSAGRRAGRGGGTRNRPGRKRGMLRRLVYWGAVAAIWGVLALAGLLAYYGAGLPPISDLKVPKRAPNVVMVAASGEVLATRGIGHGKDVRLRELPPYLPQAVVAIEDRRFFWHFGIDPVGLARAMAQNLVAGHIVQGGSTLTQQLAKNLFLEPDRTIARKVQEMILAAWLETKFTKNEILELYLNRVYFGAGTYGVEAGAQRFFGKSARHVTLAEAAVLAGLLKAPSRYAPTRNPDLAEDRAATVIEAMAEAKYLSAEEAKSARAHPAKLIRPDGLGAIDYAADWISDLLPGFAGQPDTDIIVETTIDPALQGAAERALVNVLDEDGRDVEAGQGALIAMDPSGAIKALVGGRAYGESQFNRATKALRQPGSAFKPFVYLAALEKGLTPDTVRRVAPVKYGNWAPKNYNDKYAGPVTLRYGLSHSINTLSAQLANEVGVTTVIDTARRLVYVDGERADLTKREFDLLAVLADVDDEAVALGEALALGELAGDAEEVADEGRVGVVELLDRGPCRRRELGLPLRREVAVDLQQQRVAECFPHGLLMLGDPSLVRWSGHTSRRKARQRSQR